MKCTVSWLKQFTSTEGFTPAQLADRLTMLGLEVDSVEELYPALDALITARVMTVDKHPNADKLSLCQVDTGSEQIQVVCGAPNVRAGMISALARPGVSLPDGTKIKKAKVRGIESAGMLCSARELGLSADHSGIMDLDQQLEPGLPLRKALQLADTVIEVDLTPNRPDCASVRGIAREISSFTGSALQPLVAKVTTLTGKDTGYSVTIEEPTLCPRYAARKLTGFQIGPSPLWMQQRLAAVGMRPINNLVDITNYVMLESGQPLHAFDFDTLKDHAIVVRRPRADEKELVTLDGSSRSLEADTLLICDAEKPVALAGVMGGLNSEITAKTTSVLLESACFDPLSIRRTARRLGLPSEASYRFERGVDPDLADKALQRAVDLMVELTGAQADPDGHDLYPGKKPLLAVPLRMGRLKTLLGMEIPQDEVIRLLSSIGFVLTQTSADQFEVLVPSFRVDIEREIDMVEEVARLIGFDTIPATQPLIRMASAAEDPMRRLCQDIGRNMTSQGFYEAINYSFVPTAHHDMCKLAMDDSRRKTIRLLNPLTDEQSVLRTLLLPGLLENIHRNNNFQRSDIRLYETGKIFLPKGKEELPQERMQLCAVLSGQRYPAAAPLYFAGQKSEFADIKGALLQLLWHLGYPVNQGSSVSLKVDSSAQQPYAMAGSCLAIHAGPTLLGCLGAVDQAVLKAFAIKQPVYFFEIDLEQLLSLPRREKQFTPLSRYPSTSRDISLLVPESFAAGDLLSGILAQNQKYVEAADIFDVYQGVPLSSGEKSVSLSITYRSLDSTLDDASVDKIHNKIVRALMQQFNARYREGFDA
ncbi:MAG: phenylalanine--tRNA ligase subunit beta [Desulfobulbaceae bacterium]|nr:phenylalanine--tRNA ligase subunit beta [Desulfobulbaceae bacterium]